jgi:hypothetical protein
MVVGVEIRLKSVTWNVITAVACDMVTPPTVVVPVTVTV